MPDLTEPSEYTETEIQRLLAENPDIAEQGITAVIRGGTVVLCGEVESPHRRGQIEQLVRDRFPEATVRSDIGVTRAAPPQDEEELS